MKVAAVCLSTTHAKSAMGLSFFLFLFLFIFLLLLFFFFIECYKEHTKPMPGVSAIRNSVLRYKIMKILFK